MKDEKKAGQAPESRWVNRSEFARILGCTRQAIMKAENVGMFTKGLKYVEGVPMFNVKVAAYEWAMNINPTERNEALARKLFELAGLNFDAPIDGEWMERLLSQPIELPEISDEDLDKWLSESGELSD